MGYVVPRHVYELDFEGDTTYSELVINMKALTIDEVLQNIDFTWLNNLGDYQPDEVVVRIANLLELFAEHLTGWNMEEGGEPVPATLAAIRGLDSEFMLPIARRWVNMITGVSRPLPQPSPDGELLLEDEMPMEELSPSLAS